MRRRQKKGCRLSRGGGRLARLLGKVDQVTMPGLVEKFMHPTDMYSIWIAFVLHIYIQSGCIRGYSRTATHYFLVINGETFLKISSLIESDWD